MVKEHSGRKESHSITSRSSRSTTKKAKKVRLPNSSKKFKALKKKMIVNLKQSKKFHEKVLEINKKMDKLKLDIGLIQPKNISKKQESKIKRYEKLNDQRNEYSEKYSKYHEKYFEAQSEYNRALSTNLHVKSKQLADKLNDTIVERDRLIRSNTSYNKEKDDKIRDLDKKVKRMSVNLHRLEEERNAQFKMADIDLRGAIEELQLM